MGDRQLSNLSSELFGDKFHIHFTAIDPTGAISLFVSVFATVFSGRPGKKLKPNIFYFAIF